MTKDSVNLKTFMNAVDVNPSDNKFTMDEDPQTVELENPHKSAEWIYDQFSKLDSSSQKEVLKSLEKNKQFEAMRNLLFHATPDTDPKKYCTTSSNILGAIIGNYDGSPFPANGVFSKWLNNVLTNEIKQKIKRVTKFIPDDLKLGKDYEIICVFNHYNELLAIEVAYLKKYHESHGTAIAADLKKEFKGSYSVSFTGEGNNWQAFIDTKFKGEIFSFTLNFNMKDKHKYTKADKILIETIRKEVGAEYNFVIGSKELGHDIGEITDNEEWAKKVVFTVKVKDPSKAKGELNELKEFVGKILQKVSKLAAPDEYYIEDNFITMTQGVPDTLSIYIKKRGPQILDEFYQILLICPRLFRVVEEGNNDFSLFEVPYSKKVNIQ